MIFIHQIVFGSNLFTKVVNIVVNPKIIIGFSGTWKFAKNAVSITSTYDETSYSCTTNSTTE